MNHRKLNSYKAMLTGRLDVLMDTSIDTMERMGKTRAVHADPTDRAAQETSRNFTLRLRDRDRRLISKIEDALRRIDEGSFGECQECGEHIGDARLTARPVTTLCISCKEDAERVETTTQ